MSVPSRILLSPPELEGTEESLVLDALHSGWVAPLGPHVDAFEASFGAAVGAAHAVALSSGTAALHLALITCGVQAGDDVLVSTLTFGATAFAIQYVGATPVFIDSEADSWNMDSALLVKAIEERRRQGRRIGAVVVVHLYGQCADLDPIVRIAERHGIPLIEDAAEALGSDYRGRAPGTFGRCGIFSFNGNKIITTSGGGMLVTDDPALARHVRKLATQAREPVVHYEHCETGYNYRMSNLLAAVGRAQLAGLERRVGTRRAIFDAYRHSLADLDGIRFAPEAPWGRHTRWLTCIELDAPRFGCDRFQAQRALDGAGIETRPLWKPMHRQPVFRDAPAYLSGVSDALFAHGLCLPSGSGLSEEQLSYVVGALRTLHADHRDAPMVVGGERHPTSGAADA